MMRGVGRALEVFAIGTEGSNLHPHNTHTPSKGKSASPESFTLWFQRLLRDGSEDPRLGLG